jgi:hypothetical protein
MKIMNKRKEIPSMPNHRLPKNVYLGKIRYVFQEIMMSPTDLAVLILYLKD